MALHDLSGPCLHLERRSVVPDYLPGNRVELDAVGFVRAFLSLLENSRRHAEENRLDIVCVGVASQRSSVVPVDREGVPLAPFITWHDKRSLPLCESLREFEGTVYRMTGARLSPVASAPKMAWLKRERPEIYRKTSKLLGFHDLVLHTLCDRFVTDHSLASNTALFNLEKLCWDEAMLEIFDVDPSRLCDLIPQGTVCGKTSSKLNRLTGFPSGIPVVSAGGDQQCSALGLGVFAEGSVECTTGTGSYLIACSRTPVLDERRRFLCKVGAVPGTYHLEAGLLTTGTVYRWFMERFYGEAHPAKETGFIRKINDEVLASPPGANGVLLLPHFEGSGAPHWNAEETGVFHHLKLSTTRGDMARAVLEGIVLAINENLDLFKEKIDRFDAIGVSGGLTQLSAFNQLQADVFGLDVVRKSGKESTSYGIWLSVAVALGVHPDHEEAYRKNPIAGRRNHLPSRPGNDRVPQVAKPKAEPTPPKAVPETSRPAKTTQGPIPTTQPIEEPIPLFSVFGRKIGSGAKRPRRSGSVKGEGF